MSPKFLTPANINIASGIGVAAVPTAIGYTKDSPQIAIGVFLILLSLDLGANLFRYHFKVKKLKEESEKQNTKVSDLEKSIETLTSNNKALKDYADKRHSFTEYELDSFKDLIGEVLEEIRTWQTPIGKKVSDHEKDQYLRKTKMEIFEVIQTERRVNNDDRKDL